MEDESGTGLKGFRFKWKQQSLDSSAMSNLHDLSEQHVSDVESCRAGLGGEPNSAHQCAPVPGSSDSPDLGFACDDVADRMSLEYEPSVAVSENDWKPPADVGGRSSMTDDNAAVTDAFIRGARFTSLVMPWETPLMWQIFSDSLQVPSLSMPLDWGNRDLPVTELTAGGASEPAVPSGKTWKVSAFVQHKTDETYLEQRDKTMHNAIGKWRFLILVNTACSEVGRQLEETPVEQVDLVLSSVMGVKSPNTVLKRANAVMLYYRWHAVNGTTPFLPFEECDVWQYVVGHSLQHASASRSQSLVQALRFAHYVMGFDNALNCANSKRVMGQSQIQLSERPPTRQARPLTVDEVKTLHQIADGALHSAVDKCVASNLLLALYGRCRVSDLNFVHEILHDVSAGTGFLEVTTRYHKSARTVQQKALLMPILMSCSGVVQLPWVHSWIANRKTCGLPTSGMVQGALMPAPTAGDTVNWMKRPLSAGEVTNILKAFLQSNDPCLSSHSLKATTLSWTAKAEVPREQRRILGRHSSAVQCSDSVYSRDLSVGPVNSLQKVICMIRDGVFQPDATRANYFPRGTGPSASTPAHIVMQPFTPAFLGKVQPGTPGIEPVPMSGAHEEPDEKRLADVEVKTEAGWSVLQSGDSGVCIEISSSSESDSSESETCSDTSGDDESFDLEEPEEPAPKRQAVDLDAEPKVMVKNEKTKVVHETDMNVDSDAAIS